MPFDSIKSLLQDKTTLQIIWIFTLTFFMAIVRVFYSEITHTYKIVRSSILSISSGMVTGLICYYYEMPFVLILLATSIMSFTGDKLWDGIISIAKNFPKIFRDILKSYLEKGKK